MKHLYGMAYLVVQLYLSNFITAVLPVSVGLYAVMPEVKGF
jgi:hypothetical protein